MSEQHPQALAPSGSGKRTLTPTLSRLRPFPKPVALTLLGCVLIGIPASPSGGTISHWLWNASTIVAAFACCAIAAWAELRIYRGLVGVSPIKRLAFTFFVPFAAFAIWMLIIIAAALMVIVDDGVLLGGVFFGGGWFMSATVGTIVIVLLDVAISAVIPDFRSRIQSAVLGLLFIALGFTGFVYTMGRKAGAAVRQAALDGNLPEGFRIGLGPDNQLEGPEAVALLSGVETEAFIANAFVFIAALFGVPAIISACGKLADAVMERLNPLAVAMDHVRDGELDVEVQVGGSRDLRQIITGFNEMTVSLKSTLERLDARNRELEATNAATRQFVPLQFLELLDKRTIVDIELGDQTQLDISVMFSDIRGFTTLAERIGPEATFKFINRYLARMEPEIHSEAGFINEFLGDGIMALFHTGADAALRSSIGMLNALEAFNDTLREEGTDPIRIGIGLNTGSLMLGTIGGRDRLDCTVIGDPANMAARVEGMTKMYRAALLISEATMTALEDPSRYQIREVDRVRAKGKTSASAIYEVLDALPEAEREGKTRTLPAFELGLAAYREGDFEGAKAHFDACLDIYGEDGAATLYVERCERVLRRGPPTDWDGVTRLESK